MSQITKSSPIYHVRSGTILLKYHLQVAKVPLCLLVAFSSFFGYFLKSNQPGEPGFLVFGAVLLLATGAASLNSVQERQVDKTMGRTRYRPLAQGVVSRRAGIVQAQCLLGAGFLVLLFGFVSMMPVVVGMLCVLLYNFIYTPLKHTSVWAIIPGAVCGALPPYIGWLAAGGNYLSPGIIAVFFLFVVWQIPHFWLVVLENQQDYRKTDVPNLVQVMSARSLGRVSIVWILSLVTILNVIIVLLAELPLPGAVLLSVCSLWFVIFYVSQLAFKRLVSYRTIFVVLNMFMFLVMVILASGSIIDRV